MLSEQTNEMSLKSEHFKNGQCGVPVSLATFDARNKSVIAFIGLGNL